MEILIVLTLQLTMCFTLFNLIAKRYGLAFPHDPELSGVTLDAGADRPTMGQRVHF